MSAVMIDGGLVHYEVLGRGYPVIFLHGWLGSWRYWMATMNGISDKYRCYALDLWGFGDSDKSKDRYSIDDYVALLTEFVNHLGLDQFAIVGHALGAVVALQYALCYPEQVTKLMTISLPIYPDCIDRRLLKPPDQQDRLSWLLPWRQQSPLHPDVKSEAEKTNPQAIELSLQSIAELGIFLRLKTLSQREDLLHLVVYGDKDEIVDAACANYANDDWANVRAMTLAETRHFPMLDDLAKFTRLLKDFLNLTDDLSALALKEEWRRRVR